ncbi:MAG: hypothetical protein ACJAZO_002043 [Myxococcota bacterium]|jgi:hypothetical protein
MLNRIVKTLKTTPSDLVSRGADFTDRARSRVMRARSEGSETLWTFRVDALERVEDLLHGAPDILVIGRVADAAERLVQQRIEANTALPVEDYDSLNTKRVGEVIRDLGRVDLLKVRRYEMGNKNRKTVLSHVDRELTRLDKSLNIAA